MKEVQKNKDMTIAEVSDENTCSQTHQIQSAVISEENTGIENDKSKFLENFGLIHLNNLKKFQKNIHSLYPRRSKRLHIQKEAKSIGAKKFKAEEYLDQNVTLSHDLTKTFVENKIKISGDNSFKICQKRKTESDQIHAYDKNEDLPEDSV